MKKIKKTVHYIGGRSLEQLAPTLSKVELNIKNDMKTVSADSGYFHSRACAGTSLFYIFVLTFGNFLFTLTGSIFRPVFF